MLLPHLLENLLAVPTLHGSNTITAVVVSYGPHSEPASWFRGRCMHYLRQIENLGRICRLV